MSLAIGATSSLRNMGFDDDKKKKKKEGGEKSGVLETRDEDHDGGVRIGRQMNESETSMYATDHEEEDDENGTNKLQLGPQYTLKEQLEKDKVCSFVVVIISCSIFSYENAFVNSFFIYWCMDFGSSG